MGYRRDRVSRLIFLSRECPVAPLVLPCLLYTHALMIMEGRGSDRDRGRGTEGPRGERGRGGGTEAGHSSDRGKGRGSGTGSCNVSDSGRGSGSDSGRGKGSLGHKRTDRDIVRTTVTLKSGGNCLWNPTLPPLCPHFAPAFNIPSHDGTTEGRRLEEAFHQTTQVLPEMRHRGRAAEGDGASGHSRSRHLSAHSVKVRVRPCVSQSCTPRWAFPSSVSDSTISREQPRRRRLTGPCAYIGSFRNVLLYGNIQFDKNSVETSIN